MERTHSKKDTGSIYWLPARDKIPAEHLYATVHIDSGCFNHPVLILWLNPQRTEAIILIITSFGGTDLLLRHPHDKRARSLHVPIYPSNTHPDNSSRLFLRGGTRLLRNSYVKTERQWTVKTVLLAPTRHELCTLKKKSYNKLVRRISFRPPMTNSHQEIHGTHNIPGGYGEWPDLTAPPVRGHVEPPPEERLVVHVQQIQPAPRPQRVQQMLPARHVQQQQPLTTPRTQLNAFNSPNIPSHQTERTPLLRPVQPVPHNAHQRHTNGTPLQPPKDPSALCSVLVIIALSISVWSLWRMAHV